MNYSATDIVTGTGPHEAQHRDGAWIIVDPRYRIRENPDPWTLPGEGPRGNYVIETLRHAHFYYYQAEQPTLEDALAWIESDMKATSAFIRSKDGDIVCRWCYERRLDIVQGGARACNLCQDYVGAWR